METKRDSTASARAIQKGKRVKEKDDDEPQSEELGTTTTTITDLPYDITNSILLQLPIKSVVICRCVCRTWNALISDPLFAKLHFEHTHACLLIHANDRGLVPGTLHLLDSLDCESEKFNQMKLFKLPLPGAELVLENKYERFGLVNSCNGLLCLCDRWKGDPLVVCNPVTGEFIRLPKTPTIDNTFALIPICAGIGFRPETNEYKVIRMWEQMGAPSRKEPYKWISKAEIHTIGTRTWRNVGVDPSVSIWRLEFPTCVDGALHWINLDDLRERLSLSILCFNLESERFQPFPCPPHILEKSTIVEARSISMGESRGFLYICDASFTGSVKMWVMKEYGNGESWTNVFTFSIDTFCGPHQYWPNHGLCWSEKHSKKGTAILMQHSYSGFLLYYEPEKHEFKFFKVRRTEKILFGAIPHVPSLISLKDAVKGDNIEVLNVHSRCAKFKLAEECEDLYLARV